MRVRLIAVGTRLPAWVSEGYEHYAKRLTQECTLELIEVTAPKRAKNDDVIRLKDKEAEGLLKRVPPRSTLVALDEGGRSWSTSELSHKLSDWLGNGQDVSLIVGGPDGLAERCLNEARECWSLSALTLPHGLVRVVVAEQIYRAWALLNNHPYHRD